jgi:hypothetical protein
MRRSDLMKPDLVSEAILVVVGVPILVFVTFTIVLAIFKQ